MSKFTITEAVPTPTSCSSSTGIASSRFSSDTPTSNRGLASMASRDLDGAIADLESAVVLDLTNTSYRDQLDEAKAVRARP